MVYRNWPVSAGANIMRKNIKWMCEVDTQVLLVIARHQVAAPRIMRLTFSTRQSRREHTSVPGPQTVLPVMMMEDAIRATIDITEAPADRIKIKSSYNLAGCSFTPEELAQRIREHIPHFEIEYAPDFCRQNLPPTHGQTA
jgi:hypothetical protein